MDFEMDPDWRDAFLLTRRAETTHARVALARRASRGELVRIMRGAYLPATTSAPRVLRHRHRDLVGARVLTSRSELTFGYVSAAAFWRLPRVGP